MDSSTECEILYVVGHLHIFWLEYVPLLVASLQVNVNYSITSPKWDALAELFLLVMYNILLK